MKEYILNESGELFTTIKNSGISPIIIAVDCLTITNFKGSKTNYIKVSIVLDWYRKEWSYGLKNNYSIDTMANYEKAIEIFSTPLKMVSIKY